MFSLQTHLSFLLMLMLLCYFPTNQFSNRIWIPIGKGTLRPWTIYGSNFCQFINAAVFFMFFFKKTVQQTTKYVFMILLLFFHTLFFLINISLELNSLSICVCVCVIEIMNFEEKMSNK